MANGLQEILGLHTALLSLLADGGFHTAQELADALGVSQTAVLEQLDRLEPLGLEIESHEARGYRIPGGVQLLKRARILAALSPQAKCLLGDLEILGSVDSTNALAMAKAASGLGHGAVIAAEHQSAGRGRRGKQWVSPYAGNLYTSMIWDFSCGAASLEGLSLAVGVAISEALSEAGLAECRLKWPNDVLLDGRKLGGILLEMQGDVSGQCSVVVGVGINVAMSRIAGDTIDQAWTDIRSQPGGGALHRNELLGILLSHVLMALDTFSREGFGAFHARWSALDAHAGRKVCLQQGSNQVEGVALGIDASGALQIQTPEGIQLFHGGEISLRSVE